MPLTPAQIVAELDKYIIGQKDAKRAVANALRNRYRRSMLPQEVRDEITPKNIIMKGPTGVGKTEIARRLAKLVGAPFVKVEATKYTEVGYVGRDVESMVRDLVAVSIRMVMEQRQADVEKKATELVEKRLVDAIVNEKKKLAVDTSLEVLRAQSEEEYRSGKLDNMMIELETNEPAIKGMAIPMGGMGGDMGGMGIDLGNIFNDIMGSMPNMPKKKKNRHITVEAARKELIAEESERLIDKEDVHQEGIRLAEQQGIIFIDEIDKIASKGGGGGSGPEVSREGVQRDILPIVEGSTVITKYGSIKTDYILFIAAGAFHISRVQDLIPELQGRFPIRVELENLGKEEFFKILTQPENAVTKQYTELLKVDNVHLTFDKEALRMVAEIAEQENETSENLGARRLHNIMEILLDDISYNACGAEKKTIKIDKAFVKDNMASLIKKTDLRKYVL
ncbi:MAG: ATP-dependent protease ATPase subunit HslU [Firmicutes bacterium]|nr:ATP-dependent protease ATPase subunit HslU [Bacillota bacterium]